MTKEKRFCEALQSLEISTSRHLSTFEHLKPCVFVYFFSYKKRCVKIETAAESGRGRPT